MLPILFSIGKVTVYSLGFFLGLGALLSSFLIWRRFRDLGFKEEKTIDFLLALGFFGLLGSRLVYIAVHFDQFGWILTSWWLFGRYPGLSFWGAMFGFWLALHLFAKKQKWDFWQTADELSFGLLPLLILSQVGCFFDGCSLGKPTNTLWGLYSPGTLLRRQPVSVFSIVGLFLLWLFLLWLERRWRFWQWYKSQALGFISLIFLIWLATLSFVLAFWRDSPLYLYWSEVVLSGAGVVAGGVLFYWRSGRSFLRSENGQKNQKVKAKQKE